MVAANRITKNVKDLLWLVMSASDVGSELPRTTPLNSQPPPPRC